MTWMARQSCLWMRQVISTVAIPVCHSCQWIGGSWAKWALATWATGWYPWPIDPWLSQPKSRTIWPVIVGQYGHCWSSFWLSFVGRQCWAMCQRCRHITDIVSWHCWPTLAAHIVGPYFNIIYANQHVGGSNIIARRRWSANHGIQE